MKKVLCGLVLLCFGISFAMTSDEFVASYTEKLKEMPESEKQRYDISNEYKLKKNEELIAIDKSGLVFAIEQDKNNNIATLGAMFILEKDADTEKVMYDMLVISMFLTTLSGNSDSEGKVFEAIINQMEASFKLGLKTGFYIDNMGYKVEAKNGVVSIAARIE